MHLAQGTALLALTDGTVFTGRAFGRAAPITVTGEACFNTSLSGYQEVLTDASYAGQIVCMTNPMIGNYGTNAGDLESARIHAAGFIVRELAGAPSNFRCEQGLAEWLDREGVPGISGIDTRALTRRLRSGGAMVAALSTDPQMTPEALVTVAREAPGLVGRNLVAEVSRTDALRWTEDLGRWRPMDPAAAQRAPAASAASAASDTKRPHVAAIDCGAKLNIFRNLVDVGFDVTVLPWDTPAGAIRELGVDGLFISNGPGDPSAVGATIQMLKDLRGGLPTFGICLGHQLLAQAYGATTSKLKFGHRGGNQPVQNLGTQKVEITSQNHGFAVDRDGLDAIGCEPTHINLNDRTLEGFRHRDDPAFAVQFHPESSPGPHDSAYLFDCFAEMIRTGTPPTAAQMDAAQRARSRVPEIATG